MDPYFNTCPGRSFCKNNIIKLSLAQIDVLISIFSKCPRPTFNEREEIGKKLSIPGDKIKNWFQNQRAKIKSEIKERDFWNTRMKPVVRQFSNIRVYPGCNNFFQPRDFNIDESSSQ